MPKPIEIAFSEYGTEEFVGIKHNPEVLKYFTKIGQKWVKDDETAWCAAFLGYCLEMAGVKSTKALNARSYLTWGKPSIKPKFGDIAVFWRVAPNTAFGHVGFFIRADKANVWVLGGNQSNAVNIQKFPLSQVLQYRTI